MEWNSLLDAFIKQAIEEDIGDGDHTSLACIPHEARGTAKLIAKQLGIIAGIEVAQHVFQIFDPAIEISKSKEDGNPIETGDTIFTVTGQVLAILQAERLVLNIMQRMSGIATKTQRYVKELSGLKTRILDTRKTTPGMRLLDKHAVQLGGGVNHRIGLYDMVMIKDNHIDFAGGIAQALERTHAYLKDHKKNLKIIIETRSIQDIQKVLEIGGINRIMLDNFTIEDTQKAVKLIDDRFETESSGGITLENLRAYAECGVDYISVGALTHQIESIDLSLKALDY